MVPVNGAPHLGRGINFGNALDVPAGVEPGLHPAARHFDVVAEAGFDTVRLPVRWSAHAAASPPHPIDPAFADRVDAAVDSAVRHGLNVVLNVHHYDELQHDPDGHEHRFIALWRQIAERYAGWSPRVHLELLNEPRDALTPQRWNGLLALALATVRHHDPVRPVIVGPALMNTVEALHALDLPADDHLIATVHYYAPMPFTHQGAHWVAGSDPWLGTTWGEPPDLDRVSTDLTGAADWARSRGLRLFLGEFGAFERADPASRARWTSWVRSEAERLGMSWCYWDFGTDFGAFDQTRDAWRAPLLHALGRRARGNQPSRG